VVVGPIVSTIWVCKLCNMYPGVFKFKIAEAGSHGKVIDVRSLVPIPASAAPTPEAACCHYPEPTHPRMATAATDLPEPVRDTPASLRDRRSRRAAVSCKTGPERFRFTSAVRSDKLARAAVLLRSSSRQTTIGAEVVCGAAFGRASGKRLPPHRPGRGTNTWTRDSSIIPINRSVCHEWRSPVENSPDD